MTEFDSAPRRRRRPLHLQKRDLALLESLVARQVETLDYLHETFFEDVSKKRALNRLGELIGAGYLERTQVFLPGKDTPCSTYWLTRRGRTALQVRDLSASWHATSTWKLQPGAPSIPHQIVTNRVCDWLRADPVAEHLQPRWIRRDGKELKHKPDAFYECRKPDEQGRRLVLLEVDLGHYTRQRILEKVEALSDVQEARFLLLATTTKARQLKLQKVIQKEFGLAIWDRVDVMCFAELQSNTAPGHPRALPELLPRKPHPSRMDVDFR